MFIQMFLYLAVVLFFLPGETSVYLVPEFCQDGAVSDVYQLPVVRQGKEVCQFGIGNFFERRYPGRVQTDGIGLPVFFQVSETALVNEAVERWFSCGDGLYRLQPTGAGGLYVGSVAIS